MLLINLKKGENFNTDEKFDMENGLKNFVVVEKLKSFPHRKLNSAACRRKKNKI